MCLSVCLCVCVSLARDSSETMEVINIKLGMVTTSDMVMHQVLIIFTVTFIQGHTDLIHEYIPDMIFMVNWALKTNYLSILIKNRCLINTETK